MTDEHDQPVRSELAGRDIDQARAMYETDYNGRGFAVEKTDSEFAYRYTSTGDRDMTLRSSMFLGSIRGVIAPQDEYIVSWITAGTGVMDIGGEETALEIGRPAMFPTGKPFEFDFSDYRQNLVHFKADFLERIAAEHEGTLRAPLHFHHAAIPDPDALRQWKSTITLVARTVLGGEATPLLLSEVDRLAAVTLLDTFLHETQPLPGVLLLPRNARLRAAVEFVHANAQAPIAPTDIAQAAGLSLRGLQVAFSRHLDTTPTRYLRGVRLERARAELLQFRPGESSVAAVARRWGFVHLGRFAGDYAVRFGELPGETLRG